MKITAIKTSKIIPGKDRDLFAILDKYLPSKIEEGSVIVVTSKIVAICEGRFVPIEGSDKDELVKQEADLYLPKEENQYNLYLTIKNSILAVAAGIDESNTDGHFVLWPKNPQESANKIREYLTHKYKLKKLGVIITDSKTTPLRTGITVLSIAHSGFLAINDFVGVPDIFGRKLKMTKIPVADGLAGAAGLLMGEGGEQTPLAVITDVPFVEFQDRNPTDQELAEIAIDMDIDVYAPLLKGVNWRKGKK